MYQKMLLMYSYKHWCIWYNVYPIIMQIKHFNVTSTKIPLTDSKVPQHLNHLMYNAKSTYTFRGQFYLLSLELF